MSGKWSISSREWAGLPGREWNSRSDSGPSGDASETMELDGQNGG